MKLLPAIAAMCGLLCTGCFTVKVTAPPGQEVYLVAPEKPFQTQRQWRTWFVLYGVSTLDNTMPIDVMRRENFSEVQVVVKDTIPDAIMGFLCAALAPVGLVPQTIVIQGNRPPSMVTGTLPPK